MRILYAGTPEIAAPSLTAIASHYNVVAVLTGPDQPAGRGRKITAPPVKSAAEQLGLPVLQPQRLDSEVREIVARYRPELLVCFAYGRIFGPKFLELFVAGGINLHPSLLPRHRGPSPLSAAILSGNSETGLTVQRLAFEMDAGDILIQERRSLDGTETTGDLTDWASREGSDALVRAIRMIEDGTAVWTGQNHAEATYTGLVSSADGWIDWTEPASIIERKVRAYNPWPTARTIYDEKVLKILRTRWIATVTSSVYDAERGGGDPFTGTQAVPGRVLGVDKGKGILIETGNGPLVVTRLQIQNKKAVDWSSFLNGHPAFVDAVLGGAAV